MRELKTQLIGALVVILTAAAVVCAGINFQQQTKWMLPEDGAIWVDRPAPDGTNQVMALDVTPGSAADIAGLEPGDVLRQIASAEPRRTSEQVIENEEGIPLGIDRRLEKPLGSDAGAFGIRETLVREILRRCELVYRRLQDCDLPLQG